MEIRWKSSRLLVMNATEPHALPFSSIPWKQLNYNVNHKSCGGNLVDMKYICIADKGKAQTRELETKETIICGGVPFRTFLTVSIVSQSSNQAQIINEKGGFSAQIALLLETLRIIAFLLLSMIFLSFPLSFCPPHSLLSICSYFPFCQYFSSPLLTFSLLPFRLLFLFHPS